MIRASELGNELKLRISHLISFLVEDIFFSSPVRASLPCSPTDWHLNFFLNSLSALPSNVSGSSEIVPSSI